MSSSSPPHARWFTRGFGLAALVLGCTMPARATAPVDFDREVRPILSENCFTCHGPDARARKARLRLDTRKGALAESKAGGHIVTPGKPEASELIFRITSDDPAQRMPPIKSDKRLSRQQMEVLRLWVQQGANWSDHWAFVPPRRSPLPRVKGAVWVRNPIDSFVLARLEREGLRPSPEAGQATLLRRVTFDLTGLPPTSAEVESFLKDTRPDAYDRVVDRLLASPRYGERMTLSWLDVARYADSFGYQADGDSHVWPWRDWVIRAFNDNLPFDQFITWQLAGDLLPQPTRDQRLATAFNRLHRMTNEGGSIPEEFRNEYVSDRVHTFGTAFLGLTLECSRCHDHKYDPLLQKDYYALGAFFNSIDEWGTYDNSVYRPTPTLALPTPEQEQALAAAEKKVGTLEARLAEVEKSREGAFRQWLTTRGLKPEIPGLVGHYPLDELQKGNRLANLADPKNPGTTSPANTLVPGKFGKALRFTGDDGAHFPKVAGSLERTQPFTLSFWLYLPEVMKQGIVFHRQSGTDTGFHGTELSFDDGRLRFAMVRFWPGNALAVRTTDTIPAKEWVQVTVTYDASGKASGLGIYINGRPVRTEIIRDHLTKDLQSGKPGLTYFSGGSGPTFGERFRSVGLKDGLLDELRVYERALTPIEIAQIHDGKALTRAFVSRDAGALRSYYLGAIDPEVRKGREALRQARQELFAIQTGVFEIMTMEELPHPRQTHILKRGEYDAPKDRPVDRDTPSVLPPFPKDAPRNRLGLARWLTDPGHPLTARVTVNRYWQLFFGRGLVSTPENFGVQGQAPTHPELLDWLAAAFMSSGWDLKALCRRIVLSATYRQQSAALPELRQRDPDNTLLARGPVRRLPAETLRDAALAAGGLLVERPGGPPVKPYQPPGLWKGQNTFLPRYVEDRGAGLYRRSLYTFWRRTSPPPSMLAFDAPSREVCVVHRQPTSTPLQPLVLLNDPQFVEAARALGERLLRHRGSLKEKVAFAFQVAATRAPTEREVRLLCLLYEGQRTAFRKDGESARKYLKTGNRPAAADLGAVELAAATVLANTILNLDAAVMVR
jgi:mono/diheme cytochrome c family protein